MLLEELYSLVLLKNLGDKLAHADKFYELYKQSLLSK